MFFGTYMFSWFKRTEQDEQPEKVVLDSHGFLKVNLHHPEVLARMLVTLEGNSSDELRRLQKEIKEGRQTDYAPPNTVQVEQAFNSVHNYNPSI